MRRLRKRDFVGVVRRRNLYPWIADFKIAIMLLCELTQLQVSILNMDQRMDPIPCIQKYH